MKNSNKEKYRKFCTTQKNIPIFSQDWWLDIVCGKDNWDVALIEKDSEIVATLPYFFKKKYVWKIITMPKLTQSISMHIVFPQDQKLLHKKISYENKIISELIDQLPKVDYFIQCFNYNFKNWLPFFWKGYSQTTQYSFVIDDLNNLDNIFNNFSSAKRKNIKRAEKTVEVKFDLSAKEFYDNHKMTLKKQKSKISYSFKMFKSLYDAAYKRKSGRTIYAIDNEKNLHCALFIIWDKNSAYDLISTIDPSFRNSGAASLLIKESIKFISDKTKKFDFEGRMDENISNSFRQFGAKQKQYFTISKCNSKFLKIILSLKPS
jgi:hypothetical protein